MVIALAKTTISGSASENYNTFCNILEIKNLTQFLASAGVENPRFQAQKQVYFAVKSIDLAIFQRAQPQSRLT